MVGLLMNVSGKPASNTQYIVCKSTLRGCRVIPYIRVSSERTRAVLTLLFFNYTKMVGLLMHVTVFYVANVLIGCGRGG